MSDVERANGLNAPISDSPPSGYYAQMRQALSGKGKALLAVCALGLVGVVAAIALTTTSGDRIGDDNGPVGTLGSGNPEGSGNGTGGTGGGAGPGGSIVPTFAPSPWPTPDFSESPTMSPSPWPTPTTYTCEVNCPAPLVFSPIVPDGRPVTSGSGACVQDISFVPADLTSDYCDCDFSEPGALVTTGGHTVAHLTTACYTSFHLALRRTCALICDDLANCDSWQLTGDRCSVYSCGTVDFEPSLGDVSGLPCRDPPTNAPTRQPTPPTPKPTTAKPSVSPTPQPTPEPTTAKPTGAPSASPVTPLPSAAPATMPTPTPQPTTGSVPTPPPTPCPKRWNSAQGAWVCRTR